MSARGSTGARQSRLQSASIGTTYAALRAALNDPAWYRQEFLSTRAVIHEAREDEIAAGITLDGWNEVETRARIKFKHIRGVDYVLVAHEGWPELPAAIAEH